jgi:glycosyltransferase
MEMSAFPKISIVPCTYNSEKYLSKALDSVERQSSGNLARIINAFYSSDRMPAILRDYAARNAWRYPIRCIQSEAKGAATALNTDSEAASGDLIHYLHSEDYSLDEHALARAARPFPNNPGLVWLTGNFLVQIHDRR